MARRTFPCASWWISCLADRRTQNKPDKLKRAGCSGTFCILDEAPLTPALNIPEHKLIVFDHCKYHHVLICCMLPHLPPKQDQVTWSFKALVSQRHEPTHPVHTTSVSDSGTWMFSQCVSRSGQFRLALAVASPSCVNGIFLYHVRAEQHGHCYYG